jgi:hypothetical protein
MGSLQRRRDNLYFRRTKSGNKVDFIIYGKNAFYVIEVKNNGKVSTRKLKGLLAFKEDYSKAQACLIYRSKERLKIKDKNYSPLHPARVRVRVRGCIFVIRRLIYSVHGAKAVDDIAFVRLCAPAIIAWPGLIGATGRDFSSRP